MAAHSGSFGRRLLPGLVTRGLVLLFLVAGLAPAAHADVCDMLRAQANAAASGGASVTALKKQLAALRALEGQRQCAKSGIFGLFTSCRDIARRKSAVERELRAATRPSGAVPARLRARMEELGCLQSGKRDKTQMVKSTNRDARGWNAGSDMLFCVRLEDGYFFPAPNSGFVAASDAERTRSQCRYICDNADMDVYRLDDPTLETEEMVSVEGRQPYRELRTAFRYRDAEQFRACDLQRYSRRVSLARADAMTPTTIDAKSIVLPVPNARPDIEPIAFSEPPKQQGANPLTRKVRVVGAPYLPNE